MFQTSVNVQPAIGVAGDFASANPRATVLAGPGALVAGAGGVTVGCFAWAANGVVSSTGAGPVTGFVHREQQALITSYLQEASNAIPQGFPVTLHSAGDFLVKNTGGAVTAGMSAFANLADGTVQFAAAGAAVAGAVQTKFAAMSAGAAGELIKISSYLLG